MTSNSSKIDSYVTPLCNILRDTLVDLVKLEVVDKHKNQSNSAPK